MLSPNYHFEFPAAESGYHMLSYEHGGLTRDVTRWFKLVEFKWAFTSILLVGSCTIVV